MYSKTGVHRVEKWPDPVKRKALAFYMENYDAPSIAKQINVPVTTVRNWIQLEGWRGKRTEFALKLSDEVAQLLSNTVRAYSRSLRIHEKLCDHIERCLDNDKPLEVPQIESLAHSFKDVTDSICRMMGK